MMHIPVARRETPTCYFIEADRDFSCTHAVFSGRVCPIAAGKVFHLRKKETITISLPSVKNFQNMAEIFFDLLPQRAAKDRLEA